MKARLPDDWSVAKTHCDWIMQRADELKELFSYKSNAMLATNRTRAFCAITSIRQSLDELELTIEEGCSL